MLSVTQPTASHGSILETTPIISRSSLFRFAMARRSTAPPASVLRTSVSGRTRPTAQNGHICTQPARSTDSTKYQLWAFLPYLRTQSHRPILNNGAPGLSHRVNTTLSPASLIYTKSTSTAATTSLRNDSHTSTAIKMYGSIFVFILTMLH